MGELIGTLTTECQLNMAIARDTGTAVWVVLPEKLDAEFWPAPGQLTPEVLQTMKRMELESEDSEK